MTEIKTDESLLKALRDAATRVQNPKELWEQRVSYIMGQLKTDSPITQARVRQILEREEGRPGPTE